MSYEKMVKEELCPGIVVYKNILESPKDIIESIDFAVQSNIIAWQPPYVNNGDEDYIDKDSRDVDVISIPFPNHNIDFFEKNIINDASDQEIFQNTIGNILKESFEDYINDYRSFYLIENYQKYDSFQILKYGNGQHFSNHVDDCLAYHRRISMSYYLNNDFDGGEIEFPRFNLKYKPEGNDLLLFPSTYIYNHKIYPVTDGTRYAVVNWIH